MVIGGCGGTDDQLAATPAPTAAPSTTTTGSPATTRPTVITTTTMASPASTITVATDPPPTVPPTTAPLPTTTEPGPIRIKIDVYDGAADGAEHVIIERGDEVELTITSDVADEVHVHGYDYKADVAPGAPAVIVFVADLPGIYEIELEKARLVLFELEVR